VSEQNYANHTRIFPLFHRVLFGLLLLALIGSGVNIWRAVAHYHGRTSAALILLLTGCVIITALCARIFALRAQDRAIRAEENLRHYVLVGTLLDPRVTIQQVIALRFASDEEFPALAQKAAADGMTPDAIKRAVTNWRADNWRV
jgi:hypothetical protein